MDLNDKVSTESSISYSYWPRITNNKRPLWNIVTIILVVVSNHVGNTFGTRQNGSDHRNKKTAHRGALLNANVSIL